jgi:hypothetical protein
MVEELSYEAYLRLRRAARREEAHDVSRESWEGGKVARRFVISWLTREIGQRVDAQELPEWGTWG